MEAKKVVKGERFIQKGERVRYLYVLLQGNMRVTYKTDSWDLEPGSILGMLECNSETYLCDYTALSNCLVYAYEYTGPEDFSKIFLTDNKYVSVFVMAAVRQTAFFMRRYEDYLRRAQDYYAYLMKMHQEYGHYCEDYNVAPRSFVRLEQLAKPFVAENKINHCMVAFYERMAGMSLKAVENFLERDVHLGVGEILNGTGWMLQALNLIEEIRDYLMLQKEFLVSEDDDNLYQRYFELIMKASAEDMDIEPLRHVIDQMIEFAGESKLYPIDKLNLIFEKYQRYDFIENSYADMDVWVEEDFQEENVLQGDFLEQILSYAGYDEEKAEPLRTDIAAYKKLTDIYATTDDVRTLRRRISRNYFELYKTVFRRTLDTMNVPVNIQMFLNFGFVDTHLAGEENAKSLYAVVQKLHLCKADNVYTIYEWLMSIYEGRNEPSKNEFDLDYMGYLNEQKKTGRISAAEMKLLQEDRWEKVQFEIENMLMSNSRLTYGKISSYCPVLGEYDIINSVENMLVTADKVNAALDYIRSIDFSIFYRGVIFSDPARDINMEMIQKEVLPNIILMPNAGSRAMMWQETAGIKKDTPARFMFPILTVANIDEMMIEVAGRYRWEMCRKIQGVRWNDITEPSLTSEYNDYIQYYRKNHDLSPEAKEKIKNTLYKSKNNFREVFVKDYQAWITYEAKGSFRLNKVSRDLLFKYCPFSRAIRQELKINPVYQEKFQRHETSNERIKKRLDALYERYRKKGGEITRELQDNRDFYDL